MRLDLLEFRQLGLQLGQPLLLLGDQRVLALKLRVELIDSGLQGAVSQLLVSGVDREDVGLRRRPGHGRRRCDRLNTGKCGRRRTRNDFISGRNNARRTRRIDQHRVLAQQPTVGLVELHEEIQKGFADRFAGSHLDQVAIAAQDRGELQVVEEKHPVDPGAAELVCRCQVHRQLALVQASRIHQGDIGTQRLIQRRMQGDFPQAQRRCPRRVSDSNPGQQPQRTNA
ncbi:hypothetical protein D3C76_1102180 [compost metagenome]